jgi:2-iminobutanoate/2-iminopropanoate deaminase
VSPKKKCKERIKRTNRSDIPKLKIFLGNNDSDLNHIMKTAIFITDIKQFDVVNEIYSGYFNRYYPARSTIQVVSSLNNASIEIECNCS